MSPSTIETDVAIVGAGIVGLANAWFAAQLGHRVVVLEKNPRAEGASVRNFGMIWPIGQPEGELYDLAIRGRRRWDYVAERTSIALNPCGSLHVARRDDEWQVLEEFAATQDAHLARHHGIRLVSAQECRMMSPAVRSEGLIGGLWSTMEACIDPRDVVAHIPRWLHEEFGVGFCFAKKVNHVDTTEMRTTCGQIIRFQQAVICSGDDFQTLYPKMFADQPLRRCKLQMMATGRQPKTWKLGAMIASGLTLQHCAAFEKCNSLPALKQRIATENPAINHYGIHVMAAQNHLGEVILGDSHEYGDAIEPFDSEVINCSILQELRSIIDLPDWNIARRWHGTYAASHAGPITKLWPAENVCIAIAGGAGMTLSLGLAEQLWKEWK